MSLYTDDKGAKDVWSDFYVLVHMNTGYTATPLPLLISPLLFLLEFSRNVPHSCIPLLSLYCFLSTFPPPLHSVFYLCIIFGQFRTYFKDLTNQSLIEKNKKNQMKKEKKKKKNPPAPLISDFQVLIPES